MVRFFEQKLSVENRILQSKLEKMYFCLLLSQFQSTVMESACKTSVDQIFSINAIAFLTQ